MENTGQDADCIPGVLVFFAEGELKVLWEVGRPPPVAFPATAFIAIALLPSVAAFAVHGLPGMYSNTQTGSLRILFHWTRGFFISGCLDRVGHQLKMRVKKDVHARTVSLIVA